MVLTLSVAPAVDLVVAQTEEGAPKAWNFREAMESDNPEDWTRALTEAGIYYATNKDLRQQFDDQDVTGQLIATLTGAEPASVDRVAAIVQHSLLSRHPDLGKRVYIEVLGVPDPSSVVLSSALAFFERLATVPAARATLLNELNPKGPGNAYPRLFQILVRADPAATIQRGFAALAEVSEGDAAETMRRALGLAVRQDFADAAAALAWWEANKHTPILDLLTGDRDSEVFKVWRDATARLGAANDPGTLRDWLLAGLSREPRIRQLAVQELGKLAHSLVRSNQIPVTGRREILEPVVTGLLDVLRDIDLSVDERLAMLAAFEEFKDFGDHARLATELRVQVANLENATPQSAEFSLGVAAIRVAGHLEAGVTDTLNKVLVGVLAGEPDWPPEQDPLVQEILVALRRLGPNPGSIPPLRLVAARTEDTEERSPRVAAREVAMHALLVGIERFRAAEDTASLEATLQVFEDIVTRTDVGDNVLRKAILGIGNMGRIAAGDASKDGVASLLAVVRRLGTGEIAELAVQQFATIGGPSALEALRDLRVEVPAESELVAVIQQAALDILADRNTPDRFVLARTYLFEDGQPRPWFTATVADPRFQESTAPDKVADEFQPGNGNGDRDQQRLRLETWLRIRYETLATELATASAAEDVLAQRPEYARLKRVAEEYLDFVDKIVTDPKDHWTVPSRQSVEALRDRATRRRDWLAAIEARDYKAIGERVEDLFSEESKLPDAERDAEVQWLLGACVAHGHAEGQAGFVQKLRERYEALGTVPNEIGGLLDRLEQGSGPLDADAGRVGDGAADG